MDLNNQPKQRVNGSMLGQFQGRPVCILGKATDLDSNGKMFNLTTSDNTLVRVLLQEPVHDCLDDMMVEVHGIPQKNVIKCSNYIIFPKESSESYDHNDYDTAIKLIAEHPEHYFIEQ